MKLVSIGEILWDVFPEGEFIGGAPFNLAAHAARLGDESYLLSAVGRDDYGRRAMAEMRRLHVDTRLMSVSPKRPTGLVSVTRASTEEATYTIARPAAYDDVSCSAALLDMLKEISPDWLGIGTLFAHPPAGLETVRQVLAASPGRRFYDVNLRDGHYHWDTVETLMQLANVVKMNEHELSWIARKAGARSSSLAAICEALSVEYAVDILCITRGADGCAVYHRGALQEFEGVETVVKSTVGAGDSFSAMFLHGLSQGWPMNEIAACANRLGAFVASQQGAVPDYSPSDFTPAQ